MSYAHNTRKKNIKRFKATGKGPVQFVKVNGTWKRAK